MNSNKPKHRSLAYQIILFIFFFILVIFLLSTLLTRHLISKVMLQNAEENVEYLANQNIYQIDARLRKIQAHAHDMEALITANNTNLPIIESFVVQLLELNPDIEAICLASNTHTMTNIPKSRMYFRASQQVQTYDYPGDDYLYKDWYYIPMLNGKDYWSEPWYEADIKDKTITSYSLPIIEDSLVRGVIRFDLSISYLQRMVIPERLANNGYGFVISHQGTIITHPADSLIMNETIFSLAQTHEDIQLIEIGRKMVRGNKGFEKLNGSDYTRNKWIYYAPLISNSWSLGVVIYDKVVFKDLNSLLLIHTLIAVFAFVILAIIVYARTLHIYHPLKTIIEAAEVIGAGNFDAEIPISHSVNEISMLQESLQNMKQSLKSYVQNLKDTTEEKNKIQAEVRFASEIQRNLIPKLDDPLNSTPELRVHGVIEPASDIGGDLYDYFMIDEELFCFVIADVLGKGIAAAMTMIMVSTMIRSKSRNFVSVSKTLKEINLFLCENSLDANFVTMVMGVLNIRTGELEYSNAGHVPLYIRKANRKLVKYAETHSTALGIFPNLSIICDTIQLDLGDEIILITDGITEAMSKNESFFGYQRLENIIEELNIQKPEYTTQAILNGVRQFSDPERQSDDITILAIDFVHPKRHIGKK